MAEVERPQITCFKNCEVLRDGKLVKGADVWVRGGKVIDPQQFFYEEKRRPDQIVNCQGLIVAPGFIDIQINGEGSPLQYMLYCKVLHKFIHLFVCTFWYHSASYNNISLIDYQYSYISHNSLSPTMCILFIEDSSLVILH